MNLLYSPRFRRQYRAAPLQVQKAFDKQAKLLVQGYCGFQLPARIHRRLYFWEYPQDLA